MLPVFHFIQLSKEKRHSESRLTGSFINMKIPPYFYCLFKGPLEIWAIFVNLGKLGWNKTQIMLNLSFSDNILNCFFKTHFA